MATAHTQPAPTSAPAARATLSDAETPSASFTAVPAPPERSSSLSISSFLSAHANLFTLARAANRPIEEVLAWFNSSETQSQLQAIKTAQAQCAELQPALDDRLKQSALETLDDIHRDPEIDPAIRCRAATTILRALRPAPRHVPPHALEVRHRPGASPQDSTNGTSGPAPRAPAKFRSYSRLRPLDPLDTSAPIPTGPLPILPSVDPNITHAINDRLDELTCHERDNTRDAPESLRTASHTYEIVASMDTPPEPALRILHALCAPEARINGQVIPREVSDFVRAATETWPMPGRVGAARPQEPMLLTDTLIGADFAAEHIPARENLGGAHRHTFTLDREQYNTLVEVTFTPQHSGHHAITSINYHKCWTPDTS